MRAATRTALTGPLIYTEAHDSTREKGRDLELKAQVLRYHRRPHEERMRRTFALTEMENASLPQTSI